jgi:hypothetical protein
MRSSCGFVRGWRGRRGTTFLYFDTADIFSVKGEIEVPGLAFCMLALDGFYALLVREVWSSKA